MSEVETILGWVLLIAILTIVHLFYVAHKLEQIQEKLAEIENRLPAPPAAPEESR